MVKRLKKIKLVPVFLLLGLVLWLIYSGFQFMQMNAENKISYTLDTMAHESSSYEEPLKLTYGKIECSGLFELNCIINDLQLDDDLGSLLKVSKVFLNNLSNITPLYEKYNRKNDFAFFSVNMEGFEVYSNRLQYGLLDNLYNKLISPSNINIDLSYKIDSNRQISDFNIEKLEINNDYYQSLIFASIKNSNILKKFSISLSLKKEFSKIMYEKLYLGLPKKSYKDFNKHLFNIDDESILSYDKYKSYNYLFVDDFNSFIAREDVFDLVFLRPFIKNVKSIISNKKNKIKIMVSNETDSSLIDLKTNFEEYLFGGFVDVTQKNLWDYNISSTIE